MTLRHKSIYNINLKKNKCKGKHTALYHRLPAKNQRQRKCLKSIQRFWHVILKAVNNKTDNLFSTVTMEAREQWNDFLFSGQSRF